MIHFHHVTFTYPNAQYPALQDITLHVPEGALALVTGPSGSGKSTLLRCANGLVPHFSGGHLAGQISVAGLDPVLLSPQGMSRFVGFVFQDPEAQFVVDRVEDEIAFALENAALPPAEMETRVAEALALVELLPLRARRIETLSGGELQRVAIAAALALRPRLLVLDEPTSQLDPHSAEEVLQALVRLNKSLGLTVLLSEHRLERILPFASQMIYLEYQHPGVLCGSPRQVLAEIELTPPLVTLGKALGWQPLPLTIEEGQAFANQAALPSPLKNETLHAGGIPATSSSPKSAPIQPYLKAQGLNVNYGNFTALRDVDFELYSGEVVALMGPNGAGKTTLLRTLVGLLRPQKGQVFIKGETIAGRQVAEICQLVGYLPQDPNALLFADTVQEELETTLKFQGIVAESPARIQNLLNQLGLEEKAASYPRDLSAGERQRVALGAVMITRPGALLLDEPTRGLDYIAKRTLLRLLSTWRAEGMSILLATHDVELVATTADRIILLEAGQVVASGIPSSVLAKSPHFTPQIVKTFPGHGWLTAEDAIRAINTIDTGLREQ